MNHLSPREFVDAVEERLDAQRRRHLDACPQCQREVGEVAAVLADVEQAEDFVEPSPLFWEQFSRRVRVATDAEPTRAASWWRAGWRPLVAVGATAVVVAVSVFSVRPTDFVVTLPPPSEGLPVEGVGAGTVIEATPWATVVDLAAAAPFEDLQQVAGPRPGSAEALVQDLTLAERAELVRLLRAEMGGGQ